MYRYFIILILIVLIACNNSDENKNLSENESDTAKTKIGAFNKLDSIFEVTPYFSGIEIHGDSICRKFSGFHAEPNEKIIFDKLNQIDSIREIIGTDTWSKIIGKGKTNINYKTLYSVRSWGEWLCIVELLVFNKNWELTAYEIIAGYGGDDNQSDLGYCKYLNDSTIETTWEGKENFHKPSDIEETIDSVIIEIQKTRLKILNTGTILKNPIEQTRRKL